MGKKTKNRKTKTNPTSAAVNSTNMELTDILFEFEGQISKLENQLWESELQRKLDAATALETGREEGYICGCQEKLEVAKKIWEDADMSHTNFMTFANDDTSDGSVPVHSATQPAHMSCDISILHLGKWNPQNSISQRHCQSHPHMSSACLPPNSFHYIMDNYNPNTITPPSPLIQLIETVWHPYGIRVEKPVIWAPSIHQKPLVHPTYPITTQHCHCGPLEPFNNQVSVTQDISPSLYRLLTFILSILSYSLSISSQIFSALGSSILFGQWGHCLKAGGHLC